MEKNAATLQRYSEHPVKIEVGYDI